MMRRQEITWQTRMHCMFIASTVEDENARNQLYKMAQRVSLIEDEQFADDDTSSDRSLEDIIENGSVQQALARNNMRTGPGIDTMRYSQ